jgi:integrase/recombinase XerD
VQRHKPASVNRSLISLKRYFGWAKQNKVIVYDPSRVVKLVGQEVSSPRHLDDDEQGVRH